MEALTCLGLNFKVEKPRAYSLLQLRVKLSEGSFELWSLSDGVPAVQGLIPPSMYESYEIVLSKLGIGKSQCLETISYQPLHPESPAIRLVVPWFPSPTTNRLC